MQILFGLPLFYELLTPWWLPLPAFIIALTIFFTQAVPR